MAKHKALRKEVRAKEERIRELEDAAATWKNAWNAACGDISKLQSRLAASEARVKEAEAIVARIDVEGMQAPLRMVLGRGLFEHDTYLLNISRAICAYLKEGKP